MLWRAEELRRVLLAAGAILEASCRIDLVGGAAVLGLRPGGEATKDIDLLGGPSVAAFESAFRQAAQDQLGTEVDVNTRSDPFEIHLPEDWRDRAVRAQALSNEQIEVWTPCSEDLCAMKVFRFAEKDLEDIRHLARDPGFQPGRFQSAFLDVLPFALGRFRYHAQSFCLAWNDLYPEDHKTVDENIEAVRDRLPEARSDPV